MPEEIIAAIVEAGLEAPSSKNAQPWCLHVVTCRETLGDFAAQVQSAKDADRYVPIDPKTGKARRWTSTVVESAAVLRSASLAIFVENRGEFSGGYLSVANAAADVLPSAIIGYGLEMAGIGAAIQSMWLTAAANNIAGVFMGDVAIAGEGICRRLDASGDLVGALALGRSVAIPTPKTVLPGRSVRHRHVGIPVIDPG